MHSVPRSLIVNPTTLDPEWIRHCFKAAWRNRHQGDRDLDIRWFGKEILNPARISAFVVSARDPVLVSKHTIHHISCVYLTVLRMGNQGTHCRLEGSSPPCYPPDHGATHCITRSLPSRASSCVWCAVTGGEIYSKYALLRKLRPPSLPPAPKRKERKKNFSFPMAPLTHGSNSVKQCPAATARVLPSDFLY